MVVKFWAMFLTKPESHMSLNNDSVSSIIQEGLISPLDFRISKTSSLVNFLSTSLNFSKIIFLICNSKGGEGVKSLILI